MTKNSINPFATYEEQDQLHSIIKNSNVSSKSERDLNSDSMERSPMGQKGFMYDTNGNLVPYNSIFDTNNNNMFINQPPPYMAKFPQFVNNNYVSGEENYIGSGENLNEHMMHINAIDPSMLGTFYTYI